MPLLRLEEGPKPHALSLRSRVVEIRASFARDRCGAIQVRIVDRPPLRALQLDGGTRGRGAPRWSAPCPAAAGSARRPVSRAIAYLARPPPPRSSVGTAHGCDGPPRSWPSLLAAASR